MQKWLSNITIILVVFLSHSLRAQNETFLLNQADSLYAKKKYAEAQQIYYQLFQTGYASPSTLIKMAFVAEGLADTPKALYFLWQYYSLTEDENVYDKIQVLSNAYNLKGYELSDFERILMWVDHRSLVINIIFIVSGILSVITTLLLYRKRSEVSKTAFGVLSVFIFLLLFLTVNFGQPSRKGVVIGQTYLMNGPSAASNLLTIIKEGNQLAVHGEQDVWIKVDWDDKSGYVKKNNILIY